jgi:hypothetical protein
MREAVVSLAAWRLRLDILFVRALLALTCREPDELRPEVHLYLGERYERLAAHVARRGARARAKRLDDRAQWHYARVPFDDPPRAAAMAMPVPRRGIFTDARARRARSSGPRDIA